jgi:hypothetical protein
MEPLYDVLAAFVRTGWEAEARPEDGLLVFEVTGDSGVWTALAQARERQRQALFYSVPRETVPPERRREAAVLVARLNWGLPVATFELDLDDGQIRLRTSVDVGEGELTHDLLKPLLIANLTLMDRHLPALRAVTGGATADEALA